MEFKNLHYQDDPLLICNVWDVPSAKIAEKLNFQAIGTSSAATSATLGYKDGENISYTQLLQIVKRIKANTTIPFTVDIESGYSSEPSVIIEHIKELAGLGVVGINIEDSLVNDERELVNAEDLAKIISIIKEQFEKDEVNIFINARTDSFLIRLPNALEESIKRIPLYEQAGADGIFMPCVEKEEDIKAIVESTKLPVNVMCMPGLPDFQTLKELGVKRISMGDFLFDKMYKGFEQTLNSIKTDQSFKPVF